MNAFNAPDNIETFLDYFVRTVQRFFGDALIGIYLHGSLAMGCFNPQSSDLDVLIVVSEKLTPDQRAAFGQCLLQLSEVAARPLELSVITLPSLRTFRHPSPYELHFSDGNRSQFVNQTVDFECDQVDPDLAAHFVITKARGVGLYGEPIAAVFPDVPDAAYLDSIVRDADWSLPNIMAGSDIAECAVPVYAVLNFCRVLAFIEDYSVTSKREGGEWGLENLPPSYAPIIRAALTEYQSVGTSKSVDARLLKDIARYATDRIHRAAYTSR